MACEQPSNGDSSSVVNRQLNDDYRRFFENFHQTVNPLDPLPVKVGSHCIRDNEVDGEIIDWSLNLLQQKNCPSKLLAHLVSLILWEVKFCISKDEVDGDISRDRGYEPVKLMQLVTSKINNICLDYLSNQKFDSLCTELSFSNKALHPVSVHAIRNGRRKMEDRHVVIQDLNTILSLKDDTPTSYYAIFDGHAGTDAAFYAASQLHMKCIRSPNFTIDPGQALKQAFLATDHSFVDEHGQERLKGGTTAVVILIRGDKMFTAWLGDSQAVLVRDGVAAQLVVPHKPDRLDEKERISNLGGEVIFWDGAYRVNGQLAVSRAIGDAGYKPYVTAEPDMVTITLEGNEDFLIIACDGLWDTVSLDEASFIVLQYLHHETDISGLSGRLVQAAKQKGSLDNISVIVVFLRDPALIARRPLPPAPSTSPPPQVGPTMEEQQEEYDKLTAKWGWNDEAQGGAVFSEPPWQQETAGGQQPVNPFGNGEEDDSTGPLPDATDEELASKWGWSESEVSSSTHNPSDLVPHHAWQDPEIEALEREARQESDAASNIVLDGDFTSTQSDLLQDEKSSAQWGWKEPGVDEMEADSTTVTTSADRMAAQSIHFVATSIQPFEDDLMAAAKFENRQPEEDGPTARWDWQDPATAIGVEKLANADPEEVRREFEKVAAKWDRDLKQADSNAHDQPKSDFHLSSDGSTWDQTAGTPQQSGVDWNQYDDEMSGQPSLIFVDRSSEPADETAAQPVVANGLHEIASDPLQQTWTTEEVPATADISTTINAASSGEGMIPDESIAEDETDLTSGAPIENQPAGSQPDVVTAGGIPKADDPDFHWNLHAPEFEFRSKEQTHQEEQQQQQQQPASSTSEDRKLSATELLVRSSNDAELAVLLAAANDDPDETESQEDDPELELDPVSPRETLPLNESKNDGAVEADDSEDDWTFNDYRTGGAEQSKEESMGEADVSSVVETEAEMEVRGVESCSQSGCGANDLGEQLERLTVGDDEAVNEASEPSAITSGETEEAVETQSCVISSTVDVAEPVPEAVITPVKNNDEATEEAETGETTSPVSDSAANVESESAGTDAAAAAAAAAVAVAAAATAGAAAVAATASTGKEKTAPARKVGSGSSTAAKTPTSTTKSVAKEATKKTESVARKLPVDNGKSGPDGTKPATRPTHLSPLKKATPSQPVSTVPVTKPTSATKTAAPISVAAKKPTTEPRTRPIANVPATKRVPSATSSTGPVKTASPTKTAPKPTTTTTRTATTTRTSATTTTATSATTASPATPARRTPSAKTTTTSTSRSIPPVNPAAATNGDAKPKPTTTTRTPARPAASGTAAKPAASPKPSTVTKTPSATAKSMTNGTASRVSSAATKSAASSRTTPSQATPSKSTASGTTTPNTKSGVTAPRSATKSKTPSTTTTTPARRPKSATSAATTPSAPAKEKEVEKQGNE